MIFLINIFINIKMSIKLGYFIEINYNELYKEINPKNCNHFEYLEKNLKKCPVCKNRIITHEYIEGFNKDSNEIDINGTIYELINDSDNETYKLVLYKVGIFEDWPLEGFAKDNIYYKKLLKNTPFQNKLILFGLISL